MNATADWQSAQLRWYEVLTTILLATLVYVYLFGFGTLVPTNDTWLLQGDPAQHYLGWQFFRQEGWQWPPGRIAAFGYPFGTAIVFTDSIPLLALLLKPIASLLPAKFQYFGLWMLTCYALNGYFGLRLISRSTTYPALRIIAASFFILSPPVLLRGYGHEALMAHWLVLASIDTYLRGWSGRGWLLWGVIAALCHPYLLVMVLGFMVASGVNALCGERAPPSRTVLLQGISIGLTLIAVMGLAGYFTSSGSLRADGYGYYNMNMLSLIDPLLGWSRYIRQQPIHPDYAKLGNFGQYEGFLYLGAGMIALVLLAVALQMSKPESLARRWWAAVAVAAVFWLLALSNVVTFGEHVLVTIPLPDALLEALSIFRASGRFGWPAFYLINLAALALVVQRLSARAALVVLGAALVLQVADQREKYSEFRQMFKQRMAWQTPLQSPQWALLAQRASALVIVTPPPDISVAYIPFAYLAATYRLATNSAQIARNDEVRASTFARSMATDLAQGSYDSSILYVISRRDFPANVPPELASKIIDLDGYLVLPPALQRP